MPVSAEMCVTTYMFHVRAGAIYIDAAQYMQYCCGIYDSIDINTRG